MLVIQALRQTTASCVQKTTNTTANITEIGFLYFAYQKMLSSILQYTGTTPAVCVQITPNIAGIFFMYFTLQKMLSLLSLVRETLGPLGTNGCHDWVQMWHGTFRLFNQSQTSMEGPIPNLDSIFQFDPTYPSQNRSLFSDGTWNTELWLVDTEKRSHPRSGLHSIGTKRPYCFPDPNTINTRVRLQTSVYIDNFDSPYKSIYREWSIYLNRFYSIQIIYAEYFISLTINISHDIMPCIIFSPAHYFQPSPA